MYNSKNIIHCEFCFFTFLISVLPKTKYYRRKRLEKQAQEVTIIRDNWGIPHIYGKTDADAVFGLLYAQCETILNE
jgi:acyl-homoserine lactone acylase PvdQ